SRTKPRAQRQRRTQQRAGRAAAVAQLSDSDRVRKPVRRRASPHHLRRRERRRVVTPDQTGGSPFALHQGVCMTPIGVLVVDDSAVVRQVLTQLLAEDPGIEVIAAVADPLFAIERMKMRWPDVIVLDVEMPRMDGITFLRKIMDERPTPVVICSTLTERG